MFENSSMLAALARGLWVFGPPGRTVAFPLARLVYWDCRDQNVVIVLAAGEMTENLMLRGADAQQFRDMIDELSKPPSQTAPEDSDALREFLKVYDGEKQ